MPAPVLATWMSLSFAVGSTVWLLRAMCRRITATAPLGANSRLRGAARLRHALTSPPKRFCGLFNRRSWVTSTEHQRLALGLETPGAVETWPLGNIRSGATAISPTSTRTKSFPRCPSGTRDLTSVGLRSQHKLQRVSEQSEAVADPLLEVAPVREMQKARVVHE